MSMHSTFWFSCWIVEENVTSCNWVT